MNIIFFGTPDFAVPSLKKLHESKHRISAVVTAPDKERGRGRQVSYTPVKEYALANNIPVLQPEKLKDTGFVNELSGYNADLFVIVAFRILPPEVFTMPPAGSFNLHGSLLPKYRGAAPIQRALIAGEKETGLTTFFLKEKVDTGNIIAYEKLAIEDEDNFGTLHDKMSEVGSELVLRTVNKIEAGDAEPIAQDDTLATPAPKITRETTEIDWNKFAEEIHDLVRGLSPVPGARFDKDGKLYKIFKTSVAAHKNLGPEEISEEGDKLYIGTSGGALEILEIQPEGRKRMKTVDFLRGYSLK